VLSEGLKLVILGRPNAGKSSLLNRMAGRDRAIVTEIAGTTRDTIQERIDLDGLPLEITDTAGLNDNPDPVEKMGIERALTSAKHADLILALFDDSTETAESTQALLQTYLGSGSNGAQPILLLANKIDLSGSPPGLRADGNCLALSAKTGEGIDQLKTLLKQRAQYSEQEPEFLARARHLDALQKAQVHLTSAVQLLEARTAPELIAEELRSSHIALQAITGANSADEFLGEIFSRFCIGK
jgi:tRNA modification GTPase